jgi:uncharacterized repeat protein (TIGR03837 family)
VRSTICSARNKPLFDASVVRGWRCDLFCRVVDNLGDAGICWRLANQLVDRFGVQVRLIIDRPQALWQLASDYCGPNAWRQPAIDIQAWTSAGPPLQPDIDLVIAAFGCRLPPLVRAELAVRAPAPVCINLEYLSLEPWARQCHALPSIDPSNGLTEYFLIPGLDAESAGLIREPDLSARQQAFESNPRAQSEFCRLQGFAPREDGETWLLLFCYPNAPLAPLLDALARADRPTRMLIPEIIVGDVLDQRLQRRAAAGADFRSDHLRAHVCPFVPQDQFDQLIWLADLVLVRGEDSLTRALWSGRPFIWQLYPQAEAAHLPKLHAFLDLYCACMPSSLQASYRALTLAWNEASEHRMRSEQLRTNLPKLIDQLGLLAEHSRAFRDRLVSASAPTDRAEQPDLVERLLKFALSVRRPAC